MTSDADETDAATQVAGCSSLQPDGMPSAVTFSFDSARVDRDRVYGWLSREAYWSIGIDRGVFERALDHSLLASAFADEVQIAFARVVTDRATFAWLCDVYVDTAHRGRGVGMRLVGAIVEHPDLQGLRRWALRTRDAHPLYERFGFTTLADPPRFMERHNPHVYSGRPSGPASIGDPS